MKRLFLLIIPFFLLPLFIEAKGVKLIDYSAFIGKRMFANPLNEWLEKNEYKNATEEFQSDGPILFLKHHKKGYSLTFDINMTLTSMSLYAQGGRYERFKGPLPFSLRFGMNRDSLYRIIDLRLEETDDNPFILTRKYNKHKLELLFNSKGLNQVNIVNDDSLSYASDLNFVRLLSNGTIVSGDCDSAEGLMTWNDGKATYEGDWANNLPHGRGNFKDQNNNVYEGEFKYGYFWGKGVLQVAGGYTYNGEFLLSRRHGNGKCDFIKPKGESYEGQWRADNMEGLGKYSKGKAFYYYGNISDNQFNGNGKMVTSEGWMEGTFKDGLPNGIMKQYIKKENIYIEGLWTMGKRQGKFKVTDEMKKVTYRLFQDDIELIDK